MKQLIIILFFILPQCGFGQSNPSSEPRHETFLSIGVGVLPIDFRFAYKNLASSDGQPMVSLLERPLPISIKLEHFINEFMSIGLNLNHYKYRIEWTANYKYGGGALSKYNFVHQDGRTALVGRINIGKAKPVYSWYVGLGLGWRLIDYHEEYVSPGITFWGRDGVGILWGAELSGGYRFFPFKKMPALGFYTDFGLTQSFLQLGVVLKP